MFLSMFFNKDKVFVQDELDGFFEREYQDNIKEIVVLENDEELISQELEDKEDELEDILEIVGKYPKRVIGFFNTLAFIMAGLVKIGWILWPWALVIWSLLSLVDLLVNTYIYSKNNKLGEILKVEINYLKRELENIRVKKETLEKDKVSYKKENNVKVVNFVAINNEKRYLLERKLEIIEDYMKNKKYYQNLDSVELDKEFSNQELKELVRELKQIK